MIVPFFFFYSFITLNRAEALSENLKDDHPLKHLTAKNIGDFHNRVLTRVDDRMRDDLPSNLESYNEIVLEEMIAFACLKGDHECEKHAFTKLEESNRRVRLHKVQTDTLEDFDLESILPEKLDKETKDIFISIHDTLAGLDKGGDQEDNVSVVLSTIDDIVERVDNHESLDEVRKAALLSAASVAAGSTKYWAGALKDSENSFRRLQLSSYQYIKENTSNDIDSRRRMQSFGGIVGRLVNIGQIVIADFIGAVVGTIDPLIEFILSSFAASPTPIFFGAFITATFDSIAATGIVIPAASTIVRCVLEDILTAVNCSVLELFCGNTDIC